MTSLEELVTAVEARFARRDPELALWPDPHDGAEAAEEEYSRATDPGRWRVLGARVDAWVGALVAGGFATADEVGVDALRWDEHPGTAISSAIRVVPVAPGALPLTIARSRIGDVADAGLTVGVGDPATLLGRYPDCGCDACDSGAQRDLDSLDEHLACVLSGDFRRLTRGQREITLWGGGGWGATGGLTRKEAERVIADPSGWDEVRGASWLA